MSKVGCFYYLQEAKFLQIWTLIIIIIRSLKQVWTLKYSRLYHLYLALGWQYSNVTLMNEPQDVQI